jgi:DNA-binding NarL/FixJ family response regulator
MMVKTTAGKVCFANYSKYTEKKQVKYTGKMLMGFAKTARKLIQRDAYPKWLELCEKMKPEIILLDVMMPEMTGPEMLEKLRATDWGTKIKVLILTNMGEQEIPDLVAKYNVKDVILKADMTPSQVAALVKKTLKS